MWVEGLGWEGCTWITYAFDCCCHCAVLLFAYLFPVVVFYVVQRVMAWWCMVCLKFKDAGKSVPQYSVIAKCAVWMLCAAAVLLVGYKGYPNGMVCL